MIRPAARLSLAEAEALLISRKDACLASPQWALNDDNTGRLIAARLNVNVTVGRLNLDMTALWAGPEQQQVRLQLPGSDWNLCRLCLCKIHDDVHWHCLDHYDVRDRRTSPADVDRGPYAIHQMLDHFAKALNITGFTRPLDTWQ